MILTSNGIDLTGQIMLNRMKRITYQVNDFDKVLNTFYSIAKSYCPVFKVTKPFKEVAIDLIRYCLNLEGKLDNLKGFGIMGATGTRKTFICRCLQQFMKIDGIRYVKNNKFYSFNYQIYNSREIINEMIREGDYEKFVNINILLIDDLGSEPVEVNFYGNRINAIETILEMRYYRDKLTHFTTNLTEQAIRDRYGERVYSRLREKTNFIELVDIDFRLL